jgi:high-affinity nickel-transport protein
MTVSKSFLSEIGGSMTGPLETGSSDTGRIWRKVGLTLALLGAANVAAWLWAVYELRPFPLLLGTALLAYSFGLRHAVDADHIAAIDNVTRKLMQEGQRPVCVGLYFSLGHSTVVVLASVGVALTAATFKDQLLELQLMGGVVGTLVSATFLLAIALANIFVLAGVIRALKSARQGDGYRPQTPDVLLAGGGLLARICRPLFRMIRRSWHMFPLGLLFGLGFDTATEVGLLGISAAEAAKGLPIWSILVFPALFTAGMTLIDTLDSLLMLGAYGWAFVKPVRKLYYNIAVTTMSILLALIVGGLEVLNLVGTRFNLQGAFWEVIDSLNDDLATVGYAVIGVFAVTWLVAFVVYRLRESALNAPGPVEVPPGSG